MRSPVFALSAGFLLPEQFGGESPMCVGGWGKGNACAKEWDQRTRVPSGQTPTEGCGHVNSTLLEEDAALLSRTLFRKSAEGPTWASWNFPVIGSSAVVRA